MIGIDLLCGEQDVFHMARALRIEDKGSSNHVTSRGKEVLTKSK
jgi:hypothetical protein